MTRNVINLSSGWLCVVVVVVNITVITLTSLLLIISEYTHNKKRIYLVLE